MDKYQILHFLAGILTALSLYIHPVMPPVLFVGFFLYEIVEWIIKRDSFVFDVRVYLAGLYVSSMVMLVSRVIQWVRR